MAVETGSQKSGEVQFSARYFSVSAGMFVSATTAAAPRSRSRFLSTYAGVTSSVTAMSATASAMSPRGSAMYRYTEVGFSGVIRARERSMPAALQVSETSRPLASFPQAESSFTSAPSRHRLWAMFRPTPPTLAETKPGFESPGTSSAAERPPMSTLTPPITAI